MTEEQQAIVVRRVHNGIAFLDGFYGDTVWIERIDTERLDMGSGDPLDCGCVLSQVAGKTYLQCAEDVFGLTADEQVLCGFYTNDDDELWHTYDGSHETHPYTLLTTAWKAALTARQHADYTYVDEGSD